MRKLLLLIPLLLTGCAVLGEDVSASETQTKNEVKEVYYDTYYEFWNYIDQEPYWVVYTDYKDKEHYSKKYTLDLDHVYYVFHKSEWFNVFYIRTYDNILIIYK